MKLPENENAEAVVRRCSVKNVFLEITQIYRKNTCDSGTGVFL